MEGNNSTQLLPPPRELVVELKDMAAVFGYLPPRPRHILHSRHVAVEEAKPGDTDVQEPPTCEPASGSSSPRTPEISPATTAPAAQKSRTVTECAVDAEVVMKQLVSAVVAAVGDGAAGTSPPAFPPDLLDCEVILTRPTASDVNKWSIPSQRKSASVQRKEKKHTKQLKNKKRHREYDRVDSDRREKKRCDEGKQRKRKAEKGERRKRYRTIDSDDSELSSDHLPLNDLTKVKVVAREKGKDESMGKDLEQSRVGPSSRSLLVARDSSSPAREQHRKLYRSNSSVPMRSSISPPRVLVPEAARNGSSSKGRGSSSASMAQAKVDRHHVSSVASKVLDGTFSSGPSKVNKVQKAPRADKNVASHQASDVHYNSQPKPEARHKKITISTDSSHKKSSYKIDSSRKDKYSEVVGKDRKAERKSFEREKKHNHENRSTVSSNKNRPPHHSAHAAPKYSDLSIKKLTSKHREKMEAERSKEPKTKKPIAQGAKLEPIHSTDSDMEQVDINTNSNLTTSEGIGEDPADKTKVDSVDVDKAAENEKEEPWADDDDIEYDNVVDEEVLEEMRRKEALERRRELEEQRATAAAAAAEVEASLLIKEDSRSRHSSYSESGGSCRRPSSPMSAHSSSSYTGGDQRRPEPPLSEATSEPARTSHYPSWYSDVDEEPLDELPPSAKRCRRDRRGNYVDDVGARSFGNVIEMHGMHFTKPDINDNVAGRVTRSLHVWEDKKQLLYPHNHISTGDKTEKRRRWRMKSKTKHHLDIAENTAAHYFKTEQYDHTKDSGRFIRIKRKKCDGGNLLSRLERSKSLCEAVQLVTETGQREQDFWMGMAGVRVKPQGIDLLPPRHEDRISELPSAMRKYLIPSARRLLANRPKASAASSSSSARRRL